MAIKIHHGRPAPLGRQLAAMLYDSFLLLALFILVGFIFVIGNGGERLKPGSGLLYGFRLALLACWALFYGYFWSAQGQTLGMRAWRLLLVDERGASLKFGPALYRWLMALITCLPLGLGLFWRLWDRDGRTLYDRWSHSRLYVLDKNPYGKE